MASLLTGTTIAANIALHAGNVATYALPIGGGTLASTNDQILTLNKSSGTGWGYIGFSQAGTRRFYFGLNGSFEPELGVDNGGTFRVVGGMTVAGNAVLTSTSTLTAGNLSGTIPSGVLGNSTHYIGTTAITLNRALASQTLTGVSIDGNAATVGSVSKVQLFNNTGLNHATYTTFAALPDFGFYFMQGQNVADAPPAQAANQYYVVSMGLGNDYSYSQYAKQIALARIAVGGGSDYLWIRERQANTWGSWGKVYAGYADTAGNASTVTTNANLTGHITSVGNATSLGSFTSAQLLAALTDETGTGANVFATSPTLVTPILGTPSSGNLANCTFPTLNQNTTGNAATATNVAWTGITGGARTNYLLEFQPPVSSYAGFAFKTSAAGEAGYFLVRGTSDNDVYTAEGITLVADAGWLTLAQRTTASRGVRIMTGTSSAERLKITTAGDVQIVNGNSFTYNSNVVLHAGNYTSYPDATKLSLAGGTLTGTLNGTTAAFSGAITQGGNQVLHAGNVATYALPIYGLPSGSDQYVNFRVIRNTNAAGPDGMFIGYGNANSGRTRIYGEGSTSGYFFPDASGNIFRSDGATYLHSSNYTSYPDATKLPLAGGTMTGGVTITNLFGNANSASLYANNSSNGYGSWKVGGTRNSWYGIEFESGSNLMMNSNEVGFHRNGHGWQLWWSAGTAYCHKGNPGGGTQATILDSSNVATYALPIGGGTLTGALSGTTASFSGNVRVPTISAANHGLTCVYYGGGAAPTNGYLITTNIDYSTFNMPTVIIEGYAYGSTQPIHLEIVWYAYSNSWTSHAYTNLGAWDPGTISIGTNASGKVCLHLSAAIYYGRFNVRCIYDQGNAALEGWTVSDATTAALTRVTAIPKSAIVTSITGNAATVTNGLTTGNYNSYALPLTGGTVSGLVRINNQLQVGQNTNGTAYIDAYGGYAWFGRDSNTTGIRIDGSANVHMTNALNVVNAITQNGNQVLNASNYVGYSAFTGSVSSGGNITATGYLNVGGYVYSASYLQTGGNLIYPAGLTSTQRLEVGNASGNGWIDGITIAQGGNVTVFNNLTVNNAATITSDLSITGQYQIRNSEPTITLRDTDHRTAFIHVNSNIFYILTGGVDAARTAWSQVANSRWPLEINLSNNNASFGADVNAISFTGAGTGLTGTAANLSIGGNAATATSSPFLSALASYVWDASTLPNGFNLGIQSSFVQGSQGWPSYGSIVNVRAYSGGGSALQMYVPYSPSYGGTGMQVRFGNYDVSSGNSWTAWKTLLASDNYGGYSTFSGIVSSASGGFQTATYAAGRNRIWTFGNADGYGINYYQGAGGISGNDVIGLNFGNATAALAQFQFLASGSLNATGTITATNFSGPGSNLTGTASNLNIGGTAYNITQYTVNQSVGSTNSPTFATLQLTRLNFGATGAAPYGSAAGEGTGNGITFGGDEAGPGYRIFTSMENWNGSGNYSKLTLNWHTGIKIGALTNYGGVRFYNNAVGATNPTPSEIFSIGRGDSNVRVENSLIVNGITINQERAKNARMYGAGTGDFGLLGVDSAGTFKWQIYGATNEYGFLNSAWGGWDLQKTVSGNLYLNANGTYYLNPASLTNLYSLTVANTISGSITGNAAGSSASCTGNAASASSLAADTSTRFKILTFTGVGDDSGNGAVPDSYAIYQQGGSWTHPYPDLCIGYHTGIKIGAYYGYGGTRFYNNSDWGTEIFSVGNGDNNVRVVNTIYAAAFSGPLIGNASTATALTSMNISQFTNNSGYLTSVTNISGNAATATLATKASTLSQNGGTGTGMTFNWSGQGGQPTWLWGSNDGSNIYVWNPSNFSVNYATSAGSCTGNAASVTDGVYLSTNQSIGGVKTFSSAPVATNIAKAWVYYNKSTTTINASYNVSSVTSNGTGVFTVNFTNAMVDTNYVVAGTATYGYDDQDIYGMALIVPRRSTAQQAGSCRLATEFLHAAQVYDCVAVRAVFYR